MQASLRASLMVQLVKNLLAILETWVRSLGWEEPLEEGMATHSSILAWRILLAGYMDGVAKSRTTTERLTAAQKSAGALSLGKPEEKERVALTP